MSSLIESLPDELIKKILFLAVSDVKSMLACELTSKAISQVVQDDKTWEFLPGVKQWKERDNRLTLNRDRACANAAIVSIRKEQRSPKNIFVAELGAQGWSNLVSSIVSRILPLRNNDLHVAQHVFDFRGGTLHVLAELVQEHMTTFLERALLGALENTPTTEYPVVRYRDLGFQEAIAGDGANYTFLHPIHFFILVIMTRTKRLSWPWKC